MAGTTAPDAGAAAGIALSAPPRGAPVDAYSHIHAAFRWQVPPDFNIAEACCGRWARETPKATAIYFDSESGCRARYSYAQLQRAACRQ